MILPDLTNDMPKLFAEWIACAAFATLFANEAIKLAGKIRGKAPEPSNEILGHERKSISRRVHVVEGSISKIYKMLDAQKDELKREISQQTHQLSKGGEDRQGILRQEIQEVRDSVADIATNMPGQIVTLLKNTGAI